MTEYVPILPDEFALRVEKHNQWSARPGAVTTLLLGPGARLELKQVEIKGFEVRGSMFIGASICDSRVEGVVFRDVRMGGLVAHGVEWQNCKFIDTNMAKCEFENCTFTNCSFVKVTATKSDLAGCEFSDCYGSDLIVTAAVVIQSRFTGCACSALDVDHLALQGCTFTRCSTSQVSGAVGSSEAVVIEQDENPSDPHPQHP